MDVTFGLLGSAEIAVGSQTVALPSNKPCIVLATLLLCANEFVSAERLREAVWGDTPPDTARATLQTYVLRLRQLLIRHRITTCPIVTLPRGYTIRAGREDVDVLRFRYAAQLGRQHADAGELETESRCLAAALDLWRGPALSNVDSELLHREEVPKLAEERLGMTERLVDLELLLGRFRGLVPQLRSLTGVHPQRERFAEQLIEALYRSGRQGEALGEFRRIRADLVETLGIDPGPGLRELELQILRGDALPSLESSAVAERLELTVRPSAPAAEETAALPGSVGGRGTGSCQLPLDVPDFVGRDDFSRMMVDHLVEAAQRDEQAIAAISGGPGVGKTAVAVHIAHRARAQFPDGQWFLRLGRPGGVVRPPELILTELLQNLGVDTSGVPTRTAALSATFRAALSGRRVLLVLDDVADVQQVQPLLPGTSGSAVLLTSRMSLIGLTALWGVRSHRLDVLADGYADELLVRLLGGARADAEPAAVAELAELCGGLPLALRIAATRLHHRDDADLAGFVGWLRTNTLAKLSLGRDPAISVLQEFESSYQRLSRGSQHLFGLLGAAGAGGLTAAEVAVRLEVADYESDDLFDQLQDASLLDCSVAGRFAVSGLLRRFARDKALSVPRPGVQAEPGERLEPMSDLSRIDPSASRDVEEWVSR